MKPAAHIAARLALVCLLGTLCVPALARAEVAVPERPQGRVSDYAGVLDASTRAALEAQLMRYEQSAGSAAEHQQGGAPQIAVVLLPTLAGEPIADVAIRFGERWKIGSKADDGVLLLVASAERKIRIEVGYGAEGRLPDALSSRIIRELIAPQLHRGDVAGGLHAGVAAIHQALSGQPVTGIDGTVSPAPVRRSLRHGGGIGVGTALLLLMAILLFARSRRGGADGFLAGMLLGSLFGGRRGGGGFGGGDGGGGFSGGGGGFGGGGASGDY